MLQPFCLCSSPFCNSVTGVSNGNHHYGENNNVQQSRSKFYVLQPTWRFWGEEKTDDAIYSVYLKKVKYFKPTKSVHHDSDDEIAHLDWETIRVRFIKAGSLESLVASLATEDGELESTYVNVFLATYRTFANSTTVLKMLMQRYTHLTQHKLPDQNGIEDQHRKTLVLSFHVWLDSYPEDFRDPPNHTNLRGLLTFCQTYLPGSELEMKVCHKLEKFLKDDKFNESPIIHQLLKSNVSNHHLHKNGRNGANFGSYNFDEIPEAYFAEQLTRMDMELFKKLIPHQCLGAVWSRKDKERGHKAPTVVATINQFNAVSFRVISTVVMDPELKPSERAKIIMKWIDISQELRVLKNFSSLKAIISGLQSNPVFRLRKSWHVIPRDKVELFEEVARIFSGDNNQFTQRELLMKEGTAKFADTVGENDRQLQKVLLKQLSNSRNICHGTIPYLGTFLTDLTMIDAAVPDNIADGRINFDKRRKEFEVLAQIKLLQGAANAYNIPKDPTFDHWFESLLVLDDREAYDLSCQIEPKHHRNSRSNGGTSTTETPQHHHTATRKRLGHQKTDSLASTTSSSSSSQFYCDADSLMSTAQEQDHSKVSSHRRMSSSSSNSSVPSLDASMGSINSGNFLKVDSSTNHSPGGQQQKQSADFYIIRVSQSNLTQPSVVMYKSILLSNNERTPQVIQNAINKLDIQGLPDDYELAQVLPNSGEMTLPPNANVYYAINTAFDLNFVLKPKKRSTPSPR